MKEKWISPDENEKESTFSPSDAPARDSSNRCLGFGIWDSEFGIRDDEMGIRGQGLGIRDWGLGSRDQG